MPEFPALITESRRGNVLLNGASGTSNNDRRWKGPAIESDFDNTKGLTTMSTRGSSERVHLEDRMALGLKDMLNIFVTVPKVPITSFDMVWKEHSANTGI